MYHHGVVVNEAQGHLYLSPYLFFITAESFLGNISTCHRPIKTCH